MYIIDRDAFMSLSSYIDASVSRVCNDQHIERVMYMCTSVAYDVIALDTCAYIDTA
jgi:hypothetical protein